MSEDASRLVPRTCPLCGANCGMVVQIDDRQKKILSVRGDRDDPMSRGFICPKAIGIKAIREDPDVLKRPLIKRGKDFEEVEWDVALDFTAERIGDLRKRHGEDTLGVYIGNAIGHNIGLFIYLGMLLGEIRTKQKYSASSVDHIPRIVSVGLLFGSQVAWSVPDLDRTNFFMIIGANPAVSGGNLMTAPGMPRRLREIRDRGGKVVLIDPRRNETAPMADQYIPIRPGTDALLLLAMIDFLFLENRVAPGALESLIRAGDMEKLRAIAAQFPADRVAAATTIPAETIRSLARDLSDAQGAAIYGRTGTTLQEFGSLTSWLIDVLHILTGNMDQVGGVMFPVPAAPNHTFNSYVGDQPPHGRWHSRVRGYPEVLGQYPAVTLADEIETPGPGQIRAMLTCAGNPLLSNPNSARLSAAFERLEFMASIDLYLNETTRHADVILPTTDHSEHSHYPLSPFFYQVRHYARWSPALFPASEGTLQDHEVVAGLVARLTGKTPEEVEEKFFRQMIDNLVGKAPDLQHVDREMLRRSLSDQPGPDRIIDLMLRSGPYGDGFGTRAAGGITLQHLRDAPHGLDLGPLVPGRLEALLRTPDRKIHLVPDEFAADVVRLEKSLVEQIGKRDFVLISRRHVRSNLSWMHNLQPLIKGPDRCTLYVNPIDAGGLGLKDGDSARLTSNVGQIVATVEITDEVMPGVVCMPFGYGHDQPDTRLTVAKKHKGVNSNILADETVFDVPSVNAVLNGIPVTIETM